MNIEYWVKGKGQFFYRTTDGGDRRYFGPFETLPALRAAAAARFTLSTTGIILSMIEEPRWPAVTIPLEDDD